MKKRPLTIAQITNCYESIPPTNKAGLEQMVYYLIEGLAARGHNIVLFGSADSKVTAKIEPVWPVAVSRDKPSQIRDIGWYTHLAAKKAYSRYKEFDIIHDHTYFESDLYAGFIPTPVVTTMHHPVAFELSLRDEFPKKYHKYLINKDFNAHVVSVSKFQNKMLQKHIGRPSTVIHNGIPLSQWNKYSFEPGRYFAYLGYISGFKGVAQAIQAILKTDKILKIAGPVDKHDKASLKFFKEEVEPYLDSEQIEYVGPLNNTEKKVFFRNAIATLMPVQWDEPFGLVAIESLAVGTPVIANRRGALPEIIEDGSSGFLVETIDELAEKINEVHKLSRKEARQRFVNNFPASKMVDKYEELYYKLIEK